MNARHLFYLFLISSAIVLTGCSGAQSPERPEVVFDAPKDAPPPGDEILISNHDLSKDKGPVSTTTVRTEEGKRILGDGSYVESATDGNGGRSDRRIFDGHPRVRMVLLRTSVDGKQEVTVYGYGDNTVQLYDFGDKALTATGDELAQAANMTQTRTFKPVKNFLKRQAPEPQQPLQPLPSSAFPQPAQPAINPAAPASEPR